MGRNPEHKVRIPGGPVIANAASEVKTMTIRLPTKRIPTHVSSASKARLTRSRAGTLTGTLPSSSAAVVPPVYLTGYQTQESPPATSFGSDSMTEEAGVNN